MRKFTVLVFLAIAIAGFQSMVHASPESEVLVRFMYRNRWFVLAQTDGQDLPPVDSEGRRLHAKRGHIKDYRKGNGLFGRYKGVWYWGPQLAGDEAEGIVMSDYKMEGANR